MKIFKIQFSIIIVSLLFLWSCDNPVDGTNEDSALSSTELVEMSGITDVGEDGLFKSTNVQGNGNGSGNGVGNGNGGGKGDNRGNGNGNGGNNGGGGDKKGDLYGDKYVLLRDVNGVPILTEEGYQQPVDAYGNPLPLDEEGHLINEEDAIEIELGRLNFVRSPEKTLERAFNEVLRFLVEADTIKTDAAGRLVINIDGVDKTTDAPAENIALYRELVNNGSVQVALKGTVVIEDGLEVMFDGDIEPDAADLLIAKSFLAGATDKTIPFSVDKIMYYHAFLEVNGPIEQDGIEYIAFVDDPVRVISGLNFAYNREAAYGDKYTDILVETSPGSGTYERRTINVYEVIFGSVPYAENGGVDVYTQAAEDARKVVEFIHQYEVPA